MAESNKIQILVEAEVNKALANLKKVQTETKKSGDSAGKFTDGFSSGLSALQGPAGKLPFAIGKIAAVITAVAGAATGAFLAMKKFADEAEKQQTSLRGLEAVSRNLGLGFGDVKDAAKNLAKDGLISFADAATSLQNLLSSGLSLPKAIELLNSTKDAASVVRPSYLGLGEAVLKFTEGVKNQNSLLTDSAGLTKNYSKILEEQAKLHGLNVKELTKEQEAQLIANGFIQEGKAFLGQAAIAAESYSGAKARAETAIKNFSIAVGQFLIPAVKFIISNFADAAIATTKFFQKLTNTEEPIDKVKRLKKELEGLNDLQRFRAGAGIQKEIADTEKIIAAQDALEKKKADAAKAKIESAKAEEALEKQKSENIKFYDDDLLAHIEANRIKRLAGAKKATQEEIDNAIRLANATIGSLTSVFDLATLLNENELAQERAKDDEQVKMIERQAELGEITAEEKTKRLDALAEDEKRRTKDVKQRLHDLAVAQKVTSISQIAISTALGIAQGFGQLGPIGGAIAAVATGIAGAAQAAIVAATPIPEFALGGITGLSGPQLISTGERGPEAVLPAELTALLLRAAGSTQNNDNRNISFTANGVQNPVQFINRAQRELGLDVFSGAR